MKNENKKKMYESIYLSKALLKLKNIEKQFERLENPQASDLISKISTGKDKRNNTDKEFDISKLNEYYDNERRNQKDNYSYQTELEKINRMERALEEIERNEKTGINNESMSTFINEKIDRKFEENYKLIEEIEKIYNPLGKMYNYNHLSDEVNQFNLDAKLTELDNKLKEIRKNGDEEKDIDENGKNKKNNYIDMVWTLKEKIKNQKKNNNKSINEDIKNIDYKINLLNNRLNLS